METFLKLEKQLLRAVSVTDKTTGTVSKLSSVDKIVYRYMFERYVFFSSQKQQYFDNQSDIAYECGLAIATLQRAIYSLEECGLITTKTQKLEHCGSRVKNFYTVYDVFSQRFELNSQSKTKKTSTKQLTEQETKPIVVPIPAEQPQDFDDYPF